MKKAFTLLEILLTIAIITLMAGMSIPVYQNFQIRNDLEVANNSIAQSLRRAQLLSQAVDGDTTWGVKVQNDIITIFQGTSYAVRDQNFDETFSLPGTIVPSGLTEIVFAKLTGDPQTSGSMTLTSSINEIRTITINTKGTVTY